MAQSKIINESKSGNYILENKIFILDDFSSRTSNELIGNLSDLVSNIPTEPVLQADYKITTPYDQTIKNPVIDVYINSAGGDGKILDSIVTLLSIAKSKGAIIRTTVLGHASSCGSLLAITGTPGFRIMFSQAYHFVHFGRHLTSIEKESEINMAASRIKKQTNMKKNMYLQHTALTQKMLNKLQSNEEGFLDADECLKYKLCDWVINDFGVIRSR